MGKIQLFPLYPYTWWEIVLTIRNLLLKNYKTWLKGFPSYFDFFSDWKTSVKFELSPFHNSAYRVILEWHYLCVLGTGECS